MHVLFISGLFLPRSATPRPELPTAALAASRLEISVSITDPASRSHSKPRIRSLAGVSEPHWPAKMPGVHQPSHESRTPPRTDFKAKQHHCLRQGHKLCYMHPHATLDPRQESISLHHDAVGPNTSSVSPVDNETPTSEGPVQNGYSDSTYYSRQRSRARYLWHLS